MALTVTTTARNFPFCVIAKGTAGPGAPLPADAGVSVTADPAGLVAVSLDPAPLPVNNPFDPANGTKSVISGIVNALGTAGSVTITATILNPDGTTLAQATDTLTVVDAAPGVAEWAGQLFGAGAAVDITGQKSAPATHEHKSSPASHHK
jgi:hypothetical protein